MALANVGDLFSQWGRTVLLVDASLESPGLDRLVAIDQQALAERPGLLDLFYEYQAQMTVPIGPDEDREQAQLPALRIEDYLCDVTSPGSRGRLLILTSGKQDADYAARVAEFSWQHFRDEWEGDSFLRWLRRQFEKWVDIVLIDNGSGINAVRNFAGDLAQLAALFCGINERSISRTDDMVREFTNRKDRIAVDRAASAVLIIPALIDYSEAEFLNEFKSEFMNRFSKLESNGIDGDPSRLFWSLRFPKIKYYEYRPALVVRQSEVAIGEDLASAYQRIAQTISAINENIVGDLEKLADELAAKSSDDSQRFWELRERKTEKPVVFISYAHQDVERARTINDALMEAGFQSWFDKQNLEVGDRWEAEIERMIEHSDFVLTCVSENYVNSKGYVQNETKKALKRQGILKTTFILPLRYDKCEMPASLQAFQFVDMEKPSSMEQVVQKIRKSWRSSGKK
jgi:hypothetical protein